MTSYEKSFEVSKKFLFGKEFRCDEECVEERQLAFLHLNDSCIKTRWISDSIGNIDVTILYAEILEIEWEFLSSSVRIGTVDESKHAIFQLSNIEEFEKTLNANIFKSLSTERTLLAPKILYSGIFIGDSKPKPFSRLRSDITNLSSKKLPSIHVMHFTAIELHRGIYCQSELKSFRLFMALEHIHQGYHEFPLLSFAGPHVPSSLWRPGSALRLHGTVLMYMQAESEDSLEYPFNTVLDWTIIASPLSTSKDENIGSGKLQVNFKNGNVIYLGVARLRDLKLTLEFFWNNYNLPHNRRAKPASTHGRRISVCHSIYGDFPAPPRLPGSAQLFDELGIAVDVGEVYSQTKLSQLGAVAVSLGIRSSPAVVLHCNPKVRPRWADLVQQQGWLEIRERQRGVLGLLTPMRWTRCYFVLYSTSMGHFLVSYSDLSKCPLFSENRQYDKLLDLAKMSFIRPCTSSDTEFELLSIGAVWTLRAVNRDEKSLWLEQISRGADEDITIFPDDDLKFSVKAKIDPTGSLSPTDYSTTIAVGAMGLTVSRTNYEAEVGTGKIVKVERECFFWPYTNFYKWSAQNIDGKSALRLEVFLDDKFSDKLLFRFRLKEVEELTSAIELYMEKFMAMMQVRLELTENAARPSFKREKVVKKASAPMDGQIGWLADAGAVMSDSTPDNLYVELRSPEALQML